MIMLGLLFALFGQAQTTSFAETVQRNETLITPQQSAQNIEGLLEQGLIPFEEARPWNVTPNVQLTLQASPDDTLQIVAILVREEADPAQLVSSLRALAKELRISASQRKVDDRKLTAEVASLVQQSAGFLERRAFAPRMEVEVP